MSRKLIRRSLVSILILSIGIILIVFGQRYLENKHKIEQLEKLRSDSRKALYAEPSQAAIKLPISAFTVISLKTGNGTQTLGQKDRAVLSLLLFDPRHKVKIIDDKYLAVNKNYSARIEEMPSMLSSVVLGKKQGDSVRVFIPFALSSKLADIMKGAFYIEDGYILDVDILAVNKGNN